MHTLWRESLELPINNEDAFGDIALRVFHYQYEHVPIYREFARLIGYHPNQMQHYTQIPFLPISFFKTHRILDSHFDSAELSFESSGTTGLNTSKHLVTDPDVYLSSFMYTFQKFYGSVTGKIFLCLLPSYLERGHSSLVYMCNELIERSARPESGFFLHNTDQLASRLLHRPKGVQVVLIGVTFALLDFAEKYELDLEDVIVMETGGMKGRHEEWTRAKVHQVLKSRWNVSTIHSEYGMTEMLSQAYAYSDGVFRSPPFLKVLLREQNDPKCILHQGSGLLNVIDLANIHSCSFIATDDLGRLQADGSFQVLGRNDHSALRGCSLLAV